MTDEWPSKFATHVADMKEDAMLEYFSDSDRPDWVTLSKLYDNLRWSARGEIAMFRDEISIGPTDLVHLAIVEFADSDEVRQSESQAYVISATVTKMRDILIRRAHERCTLKRGGHLKRVPLDLVVDYFEDQKVDVSDLWESFQILESQAARSTSLAYNDGRFSSFPGFGGRIIFIMSLLENRSIITMHGRTCKSHAGEKFRIV